MKTNFKIKFKIINIQNKIKLTYNMEIGQINNNNKVTTIIKCHKYKNHNINVIY